MHSDGEKTWAAGIAQYSPKYRPALLEFSRKEEPRQLDTKDEYCNLFSFENILVGQLGGGDDGLVVFEDGKVVNRVQIEICKDYYKSIPNYGRGAAQIGCWLFFISTGGDQVWCFDLRRIAKKEKDEKGGVYDVLPGEFSLIQDIISSGDTIYILNRKGQCWVYRSNSCKELPLFVNTYDLKPKSQVANKSFDYYSISHSNNYIFVAGYCPASQEAALILSNHLSGHTFDSVIYTTPSLSKLLLNQNTHSE